MSLRTLIWNKWFNWTFDRNFIEEKLNQFIKLDNEFFSKREIVTEKSVPFRDPLLYVVDLTRYIANKIGLSPGEIIPSFVTKENAAGTVEYTSKNEYFVEIDLVFKLSVRAIASIISHEITHVWLNKYNLAPDDKETNERLADLTAIFLGLGVMIINGAWLKVEAGRESDAILYKEIKPYLSADELGYAMAIFLNHKSIQPKELQTYLTPEAIDIVKIGQQELEERLKELKKRKEIDSWVIICTNCFQKVRIPAHKGILRVQCPICKNEERVNSNYSI